MKQKDPVPIAQENEVRLARRRKGREDDLRDKSPFPGILPSLSIDGGIGRPEFIVPSFRRIHPDFPDRNGRKKHRGREILPSRKVERDRIKGQSGF